MNGNEYIEGEVVEMVRAELERSAADLDGETVERLRRARLAAVEAAAPGKKYWFAVPRWVAAGGLAVFAAFALALSLWLAIPRQTQMTAQVEDMDILANHEHLDIYENMDFYRWLADRNVR